CDVDPIDCFHPSVIGQAGLACLAFADHPDNPDAVADPTAACESPRRCGNGALERAFGEECDSDGDCGEGEICDLYCGCVPGNRSCRSLELELPPGEVPALMISALRPGAGASGYVELHNPTRFDVALGDGPLGDAWLRSGA